MKIDVPAFTGGVTGDVAGTATPGEPAKRGVHRLVDSSNLQGKTMEKHGEKPKQSNNLEKLFHQPERRLSSVNIQKNWNASSINWSRTKTNLRKNILTFDA